MTTEAIPEPPNRTPMMQLADIAATAGGGLAAMAKLIGVHDIHKMNKRVDSHLGVGLLMGAKSLAELDITEDDLKPLQDEEGDVGDNLSVCGDIHVHAAVPEPEKERASVPEPKREPPEPMPTPEPRPQDNKSKLLPLALTAAITAGTVFGGMKLMQPREDKAAPVTVNSEDQDTRYEIGVSGGPRE